MALEIEGVVDGSVNAEKLLGGARYEGTTLREHLGLQRPANCYAEGSH
jgi:hypothetical protein